MRIILATAHPYIPQIAGGAQSNMHEVALALMSRGHEVLVVSGLTGSGAVGLRARIALKLGRSFVVDYSLGYPTARTWFPYEVAEEIGNWFKPDVVVAQSGLPAKIAEAFGNAGYPVVVHFHNVELDDLAGMSATAAKTYLANSHYTANWVKAKYGIEATVIVPSFKVANYIVESRGDFITLINPHPKKGLDLVLRIIDALPEQRFLLVRTWTLPEEVEATLKELRDRQRNVYVEGPYLDVRKVYEKTKILLMPSQWEEAWGRVATEAQFSGIPVIGFCRGGMAESIGSGGLLLPIGDDPIPWVLAIREMTSSADAYGKMREKALNYSRRPEIDLQTQINLYVSTFSDAIGRARGGISAC